MAKPEATGKMIREYLLIEDFQRGKLSSSQQEKTITVKQLPPFVSFPFLNEAFNHTYYFPSSATVHG